jgi:hypothetical protein
MLSTAASSKKGDIIITDWIHNGDDEIDPVSDDILDNLYTYLISVVITLTLCE